jgi:hypothetical protein
MTSPTAPSSLLRRRLRALAPPCALAAGLALLLPTAHGAEVVDSPSAPAQAASGPSVRPVAPATVVAEPSVIAAAASRPPDYALPALEIIGFDFLLNRFNHAFGSGREDYAVTMDSIRRNLRSSWGTDNDPFKINQLGHPYQGAMYYGFARSAGFNYWESAGYTFAGSAFWEIFGEQTKPSRNDQVASGIGGTFLGEALFRMSSLVLEQGGGLSRPWREAAAAVIAPSAGFNRLVFADRYGGIFSSHDAAYYSRMQFGYVHSLREEVGITSTQFQPNEAQLDFSIDYGLPGKKGYEYTRPFDYFNFQATASSANGFENVLTRGVLVGKSYEAGPDYRGVWGIYGNYDYIAPQTFRVSTTGLSLGTTGHWWMTQDLSLEGTVMAGLGYSAVGTAHGASSDRDYNYGVTPQALLALRLTHTDKASLDVTGREYFVSNVGSGTSGGHDNIVRLDAALTVRIYHQQALSIRYLGNRRDASFAGSSTGRQTSNTIGIFYTLLGQERFGTVDWR